MVVVLEQLHSRWTDGQAPPRAWTRSPDLQGSPAAGVVRPRGSLGCLCAREGRGDWEPGLPGAHSAGGFACKFAREETTLGLPSSVPDCCVTQSEMSASLVSPVRAVPIPSPTPLHSCGVSGCLGMCGLCVRSTPCPHSVADLRDPCPWGRGHRSAAGTHTPPSSVPRVVPAVSLGVEHSFLSVCHSHLLVLPHMFSA